VDCGSGNGTFVNNVKVSESILRSGDIVSFGRGSTVRPQSFHHSYLQASDKQQMLAIACDDGVAQKRLSSPIHASWTGS